MSERKTSKEDIRNLILEISTRLFAQRGLDAISVRDITGEAKVHIGAINYYFGSKEQLIHEIFETLLLPLLNERLALLDQIEEQAGDEPPDLESVLRALVEPTIRCSIGERGLSTYLPALMFQTFAVARRSIGDEVAEESDRVTKRFINALARAAPDTPYEEICWRYYLILGGLSLVCTDAQGAQRLRRLSGGLCDADDGDRTIEQMIAFFRPGMTGPAPSKPPPSQFRKGAPPATAPRRRSRPRRSPQSP